jgi:RNA polymerase sigma-70 factor (ECF subfamily)
MEEVVSLLMKHRAGMFAYLLASVRDANDAEDLLQEVSITATRRWEQFRPGTNFGAWIREIARRHVLDFRKRRRAGAVDPVVLQSLEAAAQALEPEDVRRAAMHECLGAMRGAARRVLELRYTEGRDVSRIAAAIDRTVSAAYALLKRAKQVLRDCVDRRLSDGTLAVEEL